MRTRTFLLLFLFIGLTSNLKSQTCDCAKDFDFLVQKIKVDYPGYSDKVTPKTKLELLQLEQDLRKKIKIHPDSCGIYLSSYADWFKDHHLRIQRIWASQGSENAPKAKPKTVAVNVDSIALLKPDSSSIEGVWHSFRGDIVIVRNSNSSDYSGVSLTYGKCEKNQLLYTLTKISEEEYQLISYPDYYDFQPEKGKASLRLQKKVLELHDDTRFVRKTNSSVADEALLHSYVPEYPNGSNVYPLALRLSDSTFYLRIPSFMSDDAEILTKKHWAEITSVPNLIIDIRNNGGGQDNYYQVLSDLIYTQPYESKGVEWYATKSNIKMYEESIKKGEIRNGEEGLRRTNALLKEMKKNIGGFVVHPMMGIDKMIKNDTIYPYPKRVGIIINEGNASSAEQFLLSSKHSSKVTLFGNSNTAGVLDYSNAIRENLPSNKYRLIFPMTRSRRLPEHPIDNIGISPDVIIPYPSTMQLFDRLDQWIYFVKDYLELINKK